MRIPVDQSDTVLRGRHKRAAFSATAFSTGWMSVGELEMMRRISAVAVCCSSDSVSSCITRLELIEQPHVLDRDHGLGRERFQ